MPPHEMLQLLQRAYDDMMRDPADSFYRDEYEFWVLSLVRWARNA